MNNPLTFHIIYTPNTVRCLLFFVESLLTWSDCSFRLVANGCSAEECLMLQRYCERNVRLSFVQLPTDGCLPHGVALDLLQSCNRDPYFCFMDSDIYATGEFLPAFAPYLDKCSGIFSGMPLRFPAAGQTVPKAKEFLAGPFTHTENQLCVGTTFFAIYDNTRLTAIRQQTGIGFTKYRWTEIPAAYQEQLQAIGVQHQLYDTAKFLNLALHLQGHKLHYQPCTTLRHIEAVSRFVVIQQAPWWRRLRAWGGRWRRRLAGQEVKLTYDKALPYLGQVLQALADKRPVPALPVGSTETSAWVAQTRVELLALHAKFANGEVRQ